MKAVEDVVWSEAHCQLIADHDDTFDICIRIPFLENVPGVHIAEMHFVLEIAEHLVDHAEVGFPTGFVLCGAGFPTVFRDADDTLDGKFRQGRIFGGDGKAIGRSSFVGCPQRNISEPVGTEHIGLGAGNQKRFVSG